MSRQGYIFAMALCAALWGQETPPQDEIQQLKARLEALEQKIQEIEAEKAREAAAEPKSKDDTDGIRLQNLILAGEERLEISGSIRLRGEYANNLSDFEWQESDAQEFILSRVRLKFVFHATEWLDAVVEFQDSRQFGDEKRADSTARELQSTDLSLGYIEFKNVITDGLYIRAGRQILSFGDERLLGAFDYNNFSNRFDAFSLIYKIPGPKSEDGKPSPDLLNAHAFASIIEETNLETDDVFFGGLNVQSTPVDGVSLEAYYYFLSDTDERTHFSELGDPGNRHIHTLGGRVRGWVGGFEAKAEGAFQFGEYSKDDIEAWAMALQAHYQLDVPWKPRFGLFYVFASGDDNPTDGDRKTFENLFPTNHLHYGYADLFSWQNLENLQARFQVWPADGLSVWVDWHLFRLDDEEDFWYNAARAPVRSATSPRTTGQGASQTVGQEVDVSLSYRLNSNLSFLAQYGHFFAGPYVDDTGSHGDVDWGGLTVLVEF